MEVCISNIHYYAIASHRRNAELTHSCADTRMCSSKRMRDALDKVLCKLYAVDNSDKEGVIHDKSFDKYVMKHAKENGQIIINKLLDDYRKYCAKNAARDKEHFIRQLSISIDKTTIGIVSKNTYQHNNHRSILEYDANIVQIISPCINGSGQREKSLRLSMLDLPNGKHFQRNISRYQ